MKIFITGVAGFLGCHLAKRMLELGVFGGAYFVDGSIKEFPKTLELFNIYSAMNNFREYSNNDNIKKKYEYYLDFITKDNFIFKKGVNIVIIDKNDKSERSKKVRSHWPGIEKRTST